MAGHYLQRDEGTVSKLVQRQLKQTRSELERDQRTKARRRLKDLRAEIKTARKRRTQRKREVSATCRAARTRITQRAKRARERLSASIKRTRCKAKDLCNVARREATEETLSQIEAALSALDVERGTQKQLAVWSRPASKVAAGSRSSAKERQQESDDEVRNNIDDPGLQVVWDKVKHRIKAKGRTSRTEVFAEWVAEHHSEVYAIQESELEKQIAELEHQERHLAKAVGRKRYREPEALAAVPF